MTPKMSQPARRSTAKRLLLSSILLLTLGAGNSQAQDFSFVGNHDGHGYYLSTSAGTWVQSHLKAVNAGLNLVHIGSAAENSFVTTNVKTLAWIGLGTGLQFSTAPTDLSVYRWSDSVAEAYSNWGTIGGAQQPDNSGGGQRCAVIHSGGIDPLDAWDDTEPSKEFLAVAEGPMCVIDDVTLSRATIHLGTGNQTSTLTAITGINNPTFTWSGSGAAFLSSLTSSSTVFTPTTAGTFQLILTVANSLTGCSTSLSKTIVVRDPREKDEHGNPTGNVLICHVTPTTNQTKAVPESALGGHLGHGDYLGACVDNGRQLKAQLQVTAGVQVYPNPTQSIFFVEVPETDEVASVTLLDIQGKVLESRKLNTGDDRKVRFDLEHSPLGIYFVEVNYGDQNFRAKIARQ